MASLFLPAPTRSGNKIGPGGNSNNAGDDGVGASTAIVTNPGGSAPITATKKNNRVPSYADRCNSALRYSKLPPDERDFPSNKNSMFVPRSTADFDDGGSFPEIHVAQYPRHMGNPHLEKRGGGAATGGNGGDAVSDIINNSVKGRAIISRDILAATVDANGKVSYDAIVTRGTNADKKVYSKHSDLRGCQPSKDEVALPTPEEEASTAERTQRALSALISSKVAMDKPTGSAITAAIDSATAHERTQFIRYTPNENAPGYNPQASQRIIRMVPAQIDPMQPPKHMHRKAPRGPAEDPVPVLHAPPEKLSKEEREAWNVPACISNWKNARGYTIPLDKRLAADGRGLRDDNTINSNFAVLSESLYVAERQAREEVRTRAAVQKRLIMDQRERREEELRELANKARMERGGGGGGGTTRMAATATTAPVREREVADSRQGVARVHDDENDDDESVESVPQKRSGGNNDEEDRARAQRDRLRAERRREREKEYRLERAGMTNPDDDAADEELKKKRRLENDRDVSEKVALGTHTGSGAAGGAGGIDSRLYSQSAGLSSGFGADDEYNAYSRPMFDREGVTSSSIYRPTRDLNTEDADAQYEKLKKGATGKFVPDKGFGGAEGDKNGGMGGAAGGAARTAPVQFEKGN
jgi:SNW domain-containing protein 1